MSKCIDWNWVHIKTFIRQIYFPIIFFLVVNFFIARLAQGFEMICQDEFIRENDKIVIKPNSKTWVPFPMSWRDIKPSATNVDFLLDAPTGKHGFLTIKNGHFFFEDGTRARFFGTNLGMPNCIPNKEEAEIISTKLAQLGINMVRIHVLEFHNYGQGLLDTSQPGTIFHPEKLDDLDYFLYKLHLKGIYVHLDALPACSRFFHQSDPVPEEIKKQSKLWRTHIIGGDQGKLYFDPEVVKLLKEYAEKLFNHYNPYRKLQYKDDPTIALLSFTNELYFHSAESKLSLMQAWNKWLLKKYGDEAGLQKSWQDKDPGDPRENLVLIPHLFYGTSQQETDFIQFASQYQDNYVQKAVGLYQFLRNLGIQVPVSPSNCAASDTKSLRFDKWFDYTDGHVYWDLPLWKNGEHKFTNFPLVLSGESIVEMSRAKLSGKPVIFSEWNSSWPNMWRAVDLLFITAYARLQDWDAIFTFNYLGGYGISNQDMIGFIPRPNILASDPAISGLFPACSMIFLRGDVESALNTVRIFITDAEAMAQAHNHSEFRDISYLPFTFRIETEISDTPSPIHRENLFTLARKGKEEAIVLTKDRKVELKFQKVEELAPEILKLFGLQSLYRIQEKEVQSDNKHLTWNQTKGVFRIDTPRTLGIAGFLGKNNTFSFKNLRIKSESEFGVIIVSSLDGNPIQNAGHILITAVGRAENTGQRISYSATLEKPWHSNFYPEVTGEKIGSAFPRDFGSPPVLIKPIIFEMEFNREISNGVEIYALGYDNQRISSVKIENEPGIISFRGGREYETIYYEVKFKKTVTEYSYPDEAGFIRDWLICGPFPNPGSREEGFQGLNIDYLKIENGEEKVKPALSNVWQYYKSSSEFVNLKDVFHEKEGPGVGYAIVCLESEKEQTLFLSLGCDDGYKLWVNHNLIAFDPKHRAAIKDEFIYRVKLNHGNNLILLKVDQSIEKWGFFLRFFNPRTMEPVCNLKVKKQW